MKYKIMSVCIASIILILLPSQTEQKQYTVTLTLDQWFIVQRVVDASSGNHQEVKAVQGWIFPQLQKQINDTTTKQK